MGDGRLDDMQKQDNATKNGKSDGQDGVFVLIFVFSYFRRHGDNVISFVSLPLYLSLHRLLIVGLRFLHSWQTFLFACVLFLRHMAATKIIDLFFNPFSPCDLTLYEARFICSESVARSSKGTSDSVVVRGHSLSSMAYGPHLIDLCCRAW